MKVVISDPVYRKVMYWVDRAKTDEVSGLGIVKVVNGELHVTEAILLPQRNGATHTDIEADDVCKAMYEMRLADGELKWWWHSHVQMGVFWSGTDKATIKEFGDNGWILATVFNQKREYKSAFYSKDGMVTPVGVTPLFLDDLTTEISGQIDPTWEADYTKNVTDMVRKNEPMTAWAGYDGYDDYIDYHTPKASSATPSAHQRPKGMTKKEYKRFKRNGGVVTRINPLSVSSPTPSDDLDEYGFCRDERKFLAENGYDLHDIDELVDYDFSPSEVIQIATAGIRSDDAIFLVAEQGYTVSDVMKEIAMTGDLTRDLPTDDLEARHDFRQ